MATFRSFVSNNSRSKNRGISPKMLYLHSKLCERGFPTLISLIVLIHLGSIQGRTIIANSTQCPRPSGISVNSVTGNGGYLEILYVACGNGGGVISIKEGTITTIATATQCQNPNSVFFNGVAGIVYASCGGSSNIGYVLGISTIGAATVTFIADWRQTRCIMPTSVTVNSVVDTSGYSEVVYVTCYSGGIVRFNDGTVTTIATEIQCSSPSGVSFNSVTGVVYATCGGGAAVISIDDGTITTIANSTQCSNPRSISVNSVTGIVYVACHGGTFRHPENSVIGIDGSSIIALATGTQCSDPRSISINGAANIVYVACYGTLGISDGGVISINTTGAATVTTLTTATQCPYASGVSFSNNTGAVYATCYYSDVIMVNGGAFITMTTSTQCPNLRSMIVDGITGAIYIACSDTVGNEADIVSSIRGGMATTLTASDRCPTPNSISINSVTGIIYVACGGGNVVSIKGDTVTIIANTVQCPYPQSVSVNSITDVVYVACGGSFDHTGNSINGRVISINNGIITILTTIDRCPNPISISVNSITGVVYVSCGAFGFETGGVISIHGSTVTILTTTAQCSSPTSVTVNSIAGIVYVSCFPDGVISIKEDTITTIANITQCLNPQSVSFNSITSVVYIACTGDFNDIDSGNVISITDEIVTILTTTTQCSKPTSVSVDSVTGVVYAGCSKGGVVAIVKNFRCPGGYYWSAGSCSFCPVGFFRDNFAPTLSGCIACPIGSVAVALGTASCVICSPGKYAVDAAIPCIACSMGFYASGYGSASCLPCPGGQYGSSTGLTSALCNGSCPAGYWCPEGSASNITLPCDSTNTYCPIGSKSTNPVPQGSYAISYVAPNLPPRYSSAAICLAGTFCQNGIRKVCDPGTISLNQGAQCDFCSAGTYQNQTGRSTCLLCPAGTSQPQIGSSTCSKCEPFFFAKLDGTSRCQPCLLPSVVSLNRTSCDLPKTCEPGYGASETTGECVKCGIGTYNNGSAKCQSAPPNTYIPLSGSFTFLLCPSGFGVNCPDGLAHAEPGYWLYTSNSLTGEVQVIPCLEDACSGGTIYENQCTISRVQSPSNIMCGECADGYSKQGAKCVPCEGANYGVIFLVLFLSGIFVGVMHYLSKEQASSASLAVFFYFVQTGLVICGNDKGSLISWLNIFNFKPRQSAGSCLLPLNPYQEMALNVTMPILYFAELGFFMLAHFVFNLCFKHWVQPIGCNPLRVVHWALIGFDKERYLRTFISLYLSSFTGILTLTLEYMYCIRVGDESVLYFNPAINCNDFKYKRWLVVVVLLLVFGICLVPIALILHLHRNRERLEGKSEKDRIFSNRYGLLHEAFKVAPSKLFYYQGVILGRRLLIGLIATVLVTRQNDEYMCFTLLHVIFSAIHTYFRPYQEEKANIMEGISLFLLILLSCILTAYPPPFFSAGIGAVIVLLYLIPSIILGLDVANSKIPNFIREFVKKTFLKIKDSCTALRRSDDCRVSLESVQLTIPSRPSLERLNPREEANPNYPDSPASSSFSTHVEITELALPSAVTRVRKFRRSKSKNKTEGKTSSLPGFVQ